MLSRSLHSFITIITISIVLATYLIGSLYAQSNGMDANGTNWLNYKLNNQSSAESEGERLSEYQYLNDIPSNANILIDNIDKLSVQHYKIFNSRYKDDVIPNLVFIDDTLIFISSTQDILKLDSNLSVIEKKYLKSLPNSITGILLDDQSNLILSSYNGIIMAIDIDDDYKTIWKNDVSYPILTAPISLENKVFVLANDSLFAIHKQTGSLVWSTSAVKQGLSLKQAYTLSYNNDYIYAGASNGNFSIVRQHNGEVVLKEHLHSTGFNTLNDIKSNILLSGDNIFVSSYGNKTASYNIQTKSFNWKLNDETTSQPMTLYNKDFIFMTNSNNEIVKISRTNGKIIWKKDLSQFSKYNLYSGFLWSKPFIINNNQVISISNKGDIAVLSAIDGKTILTKNLVTLAPEEFLSTSPLLIYNSIYLISNMSNIYLIQ